MAKPNRFRIACLLLAALTLLLYWVAPDVKGRIQGSRLHFLSSCKRQMEYLCADLEQISFENRTRESFGGEAYEVFCREIEDMDSSIPHPGRELYYSGKTQYIASGSFQMVGQFKYRFRDVTDRKYFVVSVKFSPPSRCSMSSFYTDKPLSALNALVKAGGSDR